MNYFCIVLQNSKNIYSKWCIVVIFIIFSITSFYQNKMYNTKTNIIIWDGYGYYLYLPAIYIYKDTKKFNFVNTHIEKYKISNHFYQLISTNGDNKSPLYNIGLSILWTPFFLASHFSCKFFTSYNADGMSYPYQWGIFFAALFYLALGFIYIRKLLMLLHFDDVIISIVLITIAFGTNYYYYAIHGLEMTHIYLFALQAMFVFHLHLYIQNHKQKNLIFLSLLTAIMVLIRSSEIVIFVLAAFYNLNSFSNWKRNVKIVFSMFLATSFLFMFQLFFYKFNNNVWFINGYKDFSFLWLHPKFWYCLFSPTKGWIIYTPIIILAFIGFLFPNKNNTVERLAIGLFIICNCYLLFCWSDFNYGTTFGCRPIVQSYAILSMLFALFFQKIKSFSKYIKFVMVLFILGCIGLNIFQTWQYKHNMLAYKNNTWSYYWYCFGKTNITLHDLIYLRIDEKFYHQKYQLQSIYNCDTTLQHLGILYKNHLDYLPIKKIEVGFNNIKDLSNQWMHIRFDAMYKGDACSNENMPSIIIDASRGNQNLKWNIIGIPVIMNSRKLDSISFFIKNPELKIGDVWNIYALNQTADSVYIQNFKINKVNVEGY
jgi:hypothetical protein